MPAPICPKCNTVKNWYPDSTVPGLGAWLCMPCHYREHKPPQASRMATWGLSALFSFILMCLSALIPPLLFFTVPVFVVCALFGWAFTPPKMPA